ncbi:MAG: pirin family protein [Anaerolineae bacterium]|nr:pirin family protein [Anaerolineae bacterium]
MKMRTVRKVYTGTASVDGAGVHLNRIFANQDTFELDPFLLLDYFDASDPNQYIKGFPWHPHRGIETITYLMDGLLEHGDSLGNSGVIEPLGCQWMTAGSGIIHQEMPQAAEHMHGAQLWLNLPRKDKMTDPAYRDITASDLAVYEDEDVLVRVICGDYKGHVGPVKGTYVEPFYFDLEIKPGGTFTMDIDPEETVFLLLVQGSLSFPDGSVYGKAQSKGLLLTKGDTIQLSSVEGGRCLMMAGKPLREPVAWGGPIVMNTREELRQAFSELDEGTFIKKK